MNRLLCAALLLCLPACSSRSAQPDNMAAPVTQALLPLVIRSAKGDHRFDVEVARTAQEEEKGLMFRNSVDTDGGMLFPMNPPRTASFWMKNTLVPLDMIFIRTDGSIAFIARNTVPYSREPVSAGIPVAAVLELRGGRAAELGIREDDRVRWGPCAAPNMKAGQAKPLADLNFCPAN